MADQMRSKCNKEVMQMYLGGEPWLETMWCRRWVLMMPSGMSQSPCPSHTLHATITFSLLGSCFACIQV